MTDKGGRFTLQPSSPFLREKSGRSLETMDSQLSVFADHFSTLHEQSVAFVRSLSDAQLYEDPRPQANSMTMFSCGEYILRSAAAVEQTFGGVTTRLWDDPFEWTLPEKLSTSKLVIDYLNEVDATTRHGFAFFKSDADLMKQIPAPERIRSIFDLLLDTLRRAEHYQGRAFAVFQMVSDAKLPRV